MIYDEVSFLTTVLVQYINSVLTQVQISTDDM